VRVLGRRRHSLVALAATVLCLAGPVWPAAAQPNVRPPGVPPAVDMSAVPSAASVSAMPYHVNNPATRQIGPVEQQAPCQPQATSSGQNVAGERRRSGSCGSAKRSDTQPAAASESQ
jgi:hypothetical protein